MKKLYKVAFLTFLLMLSFSNVGNAQSYFQQVVNYSIDVKLNDVKNTIVGSESIEYTNHSPNSLSIIYMHLWPNAYKDNTTCLAKQLLQSGNRIMYYAKDEDLGYIDSIDFKVDGEKVKWELLKDSIDIARIYLNKPLNSNEKILITTPFFVKIPTGKISRLGHIGQSYQITQWYPKPAVYDSNGWNYMPYLNQGEFYSEFASFDVRITVPKNYVLGATGDRIDADEEEKWMDEKVYETGKIKTFDSKDMSFPKSNDTTKTIRFKQSNVHDFAWFCDKRYHVLKGEIITPHTKNKVTTWVLFTNAEANLWKNSIAYVNDAVYYYSLWNGDYPYKQCTAVDGTISAGGGMEYPNITVIGSSGSAFQLDVVIAHEVGHNWFYGMLGSNERLHPWMDEGINSFNELRYVETKYPNQKLIGRFAENEVGKVFDLSRLTHRSQSELTYWLSAAINEDQPIEFPAYNYTSLNYGGIVYSKTALAFNYLKSYLGNEKFDKAMQAYFDEWHFKHPQPKDLREIFAKEISEKNLNWFFDDLIGTTKKVDYKIKKVKKTNSNEYNLIIKNKGKINSPLIIQALKNGSVVNEMTYEGFAGKRTLSFAGTDYNAFKIDAKEVIPEINRNNNEIKTKGLFKKAAPLKLQFLASVNNPQKTQVYFSPVVGWNDYNKWMFGMAFYNNIFPEKKFEFQLMPLYSVAQNNVAGSGNISYSIFPNNNLFQRISFAVAGSRYSYSNEPFQLNFNKIAPELKIVFRKSTELSPYKVSLRYRNISLITDDYTVLVDQSEVTYKSSSTFKNFNVLNLVFAKSDAIQPYSFNLEGQQADNMAKASLTFNYSYNFKKKNRSFDVRFFAGTFIATSANNAGPYRFRLSGQRGYQDYLFDNIFLGRSEYTGVLSNQFTNTDGAFKAYSPLGQSTSWITALNLKSSLGNFKLPLNVYADLGYCPKDAAIVNNQFLYNAGLSVTLMRNVCEIYFPLLLSSDIKDYNKLNNISYGETIRFTLNINLINPFELVKNISF